MKYQLARHGWPVGQHLIPEGTQIDTSLPEWAFLAKRDPPPNAYALDQAAYDALALAYPFSTHLILSGPGINRHADPLG